MTDDLFNVNAGWEERDGRSICRWILVWQETGPGVIAGVLGGYSGGGSFQLEQLYAKFSDDGLTNLLIDTEDKVTGDYIVFFEDVPGEILSLCDDAQDVVWEWHDEDEWEDAEQLLLLEGRASELSSDGQLLYLAKDFTPFAREILEKAGITAAPSSS